MIPRLFSLRLPICAVRNYTSYNLPPTINQLLSSPPPPTQQVTVHGWIRSIRPHKSVAFLDVSDGTTHRGLQVVLSPTFAQGGLSTGTSVRLEGRLVMSQGGGQEREMCVDSMVVLGKCDPETYPIQKKSLPVQLLRENTHLRGRTASIAAMLRIRDKLTRAFVAWFEREGFIYTHAPSMTGIDCEGTGEAFRIVPPLSPIPSPPTYLTTSTQLHLEALTAAFARVYTLAPSFRAERSQTNRHLSEFWMLEAEISFINKLLDVCDVVEAALKTVLKELQDDQDVAALRGQETWVDTERKWERVTYTNALDLLRAHHVSGTEPRFAFAPPEWGGAFASEHERWLAQSLGPVFVTDYPRLLKPFYMWANEGDGMETVACFDFLVPRVGEIVGGSMRESRLDVLRESMKARGMDEIHYGWYLDLRRYGTTPHGGFGIGFDRLASWVTGFENLRECIAFPRWAGKVPL